MTGLRIRCLGAFEVWRDDHRISGFESQKVVALLAYLVAHRDRALSREHLAGLLWPEKNEDAARRNLRQALYNLKTTLNGKGEGPPLVLSNHRQIRFNSEVDLWLDIESFSRLLVEGLGDGKLVPHVLAEAVSLYRGEFLIDLQLKDTPDFEFWLLSEQERLRDGAIEALKSLISSYQSRGEFRLGIQFARRLVALDPLSETAHRSLIRLFALAGRRSQAVAHYDDLRRLLNQELGVEPMDETRLLYESMLSREGPPPEESEPSSAPGGPIIPLVGRSSPLRVLQQTWGQVLAGCARATLVAGEAGVGKTRLVKSFLDTASSLDGLRVVKGKCDERIPIAYQPFDQVLRNAISDDSLQAHEALAKASSEILAGLAHLIPDLEDIRPETPLPSARPIGDQTQLYQLIADVLALLCPPADGQGALVLLLDDMHRTSEESIDLLRFLSSQLADLPIWFLVLYRDNETTEDHPLRGLITTDQADKAMAVGCLRLDRLETGEVSEIAAALVSDEEAPTLARFLKEGAQGLPLAITEWINTLWDEDILTWSDGRWKLRDSLEELPLGDISTLEDLMVHRIRRLPRSARRLATLAAAGGHKFNVELLQRADDEHTSVVELALELMIERWLMRQFADFWMTSRRLRDIVLWAEGARRGNFEFSHKAIREALYSAVPTARRRVMHRQLAETLEQMHRDDPDMVCELLAFHYFSAEDWPAAEQQCRRAATKSRRLFAERTAAYYEERAHKAAAKAEQAG